MKTIRTRPIAVNHARCLAGALFLGVAAPFQGQAQDKPGAPAAPPSPPAASPSWLDNEFAQAFTKGKFNFDVRLRYEYAEQSNLRESNALTIRPRFGFTTAPLHGFQGMLEAEHVQSILPKHNYFVPGLHGAGRTVIADPEATELNQAWISYSNWKTTAKVGRQRLVLDNVRFVGDVGWRQNAQTFDAVSVENKSIENLTLQYAYLWEINRVFGDDHRLPAAFQDFTSDSHILHATYTGLKWASLNAYSYLLDFDNSAGNSTATYGGFLAGTYTFDKEHNGKLSYRGEFAWQTDYHSSPFSYEAEYAAAELAADYSRFTLGGGVEILGSDNGQGFKTPLATLHAFNGWADVFLNTPGNGLQDYYAFAGVKLPGNIPLRVYFHKFESDTGSSDYGSEWDIVLSRQFGKHFTAMIKYARYDGHDAPAAWDLQRFWTQIEFKF